MFQSQYTVSLTEGFPIYFLCPHCRLLHRFPEGMLPAFQDPDEASNVFLLFFGPPFATWEYVSEEKMLKMLADGR